MAKATALNKGITELLEKPAEDSFRIQLVKLGAIYPSDTNPRKHFDEQALADLAQSMKASGLIQPITLRPGIDDRFEIVAGERRYHAAALLGWPTIKAIIRNISDTEVLEIQIIEN